MSNRPDNHEVTYQGGSDIFRVVTRRELNNMGVTVEEATQILGACNFDVLQPHTAIGLIRDEIEQVRAQNGQGAHSNNRTLFE